MNYRCAGYLMFFTHIDRPMQLMADLVSQEAYAEEATPVIRAWTEARYRQPDATTHARAAAGASSSTVTSG